MEPDLYSKQELHGFIGLLLQHLSYTAISRPDAAHARELLEHPELASASRGEGELPVEKDADGMRDGMGFRDEGWDRQISFGQLGYDLPNCRGHCL